VYMCCSCTLSLQKKSGSQAKPCPLVVLSYVPSRYTVALWPIFGPIILVELVRELPPPANPFPYPPSPTTNQVTCHESLQTVFRKTYSCRHTQRG